MGSPTTPTAQRVSLVRLDEHRDDFPDDVRRGLTTSPKTLPPKYFYDELGSVLFEAICRLPEYYVSRCEEEIFGKCGDDIVQSFGPPVRLIELGSGSSRKTRMLLDRLARRQPEIEYVAVDVDGDLLRQTAQTLTEIYPTLVFRGVVSDFRRIAQILASLDAERTRRNVVLFLGSTIGNLDAGEQQELLRAIRQPLRAGDMLFLGTDQRKDIAILEPAYDDALGVTAAFNLNLLVRINRVLGGHFDLSTFRHRAFFNAAFSRIEMHLVSTIDQIVRIDALDLDASFTTGETIHTESSYKFDEATIGTLALTTGFEVQRRWTDSRHYFADALLVARAAKGDSL